MSRFIFYKLLLLFVFLISSSLHGLAQQKKTQVRVKTKPPEVLPVGLDQIPEFPGGTTELKKFFAANIHYPDQAKENGLTGQVVIVFFIDEQGYPEDAKIINDLGYGCGEEALRVIRIMPQWHPRKVKGKAVKSLFELPVDFKMD